MVVACNLAYASVYDVLVSCVCDAVCLGNPAGNEFSEKQPLEGNYRSQYILSTIDSSNWIEGECKTVSIELASTVILPVKIVSKADAGTAKASAEIGSLQNMKVQKSYKMQRHNGQNHSCLVHSYPEKGYGSGEKRCTESNLIFSDQYKLANGKLQAHETSAHGDLKDSQTANQDGILKLSSLGHIAEPKNSLLSPEDNFDALMASIVNASIIKSSTWFVDRQYEYAKGVCQGHMNSSKTSGSTSDTFQQMILSVNEESESGVECLGSCENFGEHAVQDIPEGAELSLSKSVVGEPMQLPNISTNSNYFNLLHSSPQKPLTACSRKKLLILDINGLLADIVYPLPKGYKADIKIAGRAVFKRPSCSDFLNFCFERFDVGVWSSRSKRIVERVVHVLMGDVKHKLVFCWDLSHCTESNFRTLENRHKKLVFKELRKIWEKYDPNLPWEEGDFDESNTLLLDDSPYKALLNPPHTAVFPYSYDFKDRDDDSIAGPGGNIRAYLEELAGAENVQEYIKKHHFGQSALTERSLSWQFYDKVIQRQYAVPAAE